jgi:tetratricopeptide (TPR) repeat protein
MATWTAFPHLGEYRLDLATLKHQWARLHGGDAEPLPEDEDLLQAWTLFHNGRFQDAAETGLKLGGSGITLANKATAIYASYLEPNESARHALFMTVAQRAQAQATQDADNPNAWYWQAYALGRYSQRISVAKAMAQGLGGKVKGALERTLKLQPRHADAHIALGAFHAEVIDKVGSLIGGMTYGTRKEVGLQLFQEALKIHPTSVIGMVEYANGLVMLEGENRMNEATRLYRQAAASQPVDAKERLDTELAKAQLAH